MGVVVRRRTCVREGKRKLGKTDSARHDTH